MEYCSLNERGGEGKQYLLYSPKHVEINILMKQNMVIEQCFSALEA